MLNLFGASLLSQPGIPKLRRTAKKKLRFKGKGHEVGEAENAISVGVAFLTRINVIVLRRGTLVELLPIVA